MEDGSPSCEGAKASAPGNPLSLEQEFLNEVEDNMDNAEAVDVQRRLLDRSSEYDLLRKLRHHFHAEFSGNTQDSVRSKIADWGICCQIVHSIMLRGVE